MAMTSGTVTIDDAGVVSGGGAARAVFDAYAATLTPLLGPLTPEAKVGVYRSAADLCNSVAKMIDYIKAEGHARVSAGGLQKLPATITVGQPTAAPDAPVDLALV
jgi:hypothetical protein